MDKITLDEVLAEHEKLSLIKEEDLATKFFGPKLTRSQAAQIRLPTGASRKTSKFRGVGKRGDNKWGARIVYKGRSINLGIYAREIEAAKVYDDAAYKLFGEYAFLNFSKGKSHVQQR